jgi:hypothetical protein
MGLHSKNIRVIGKNLFTFKILIKVILKIQVTKSRNQEVERIQKGIWRQEGKASQSR